MSDRQYVVDVYVEGFRRGDHPLILGCLTDDVVWDLPGHRHLQGKDAFDAEIDNPDFTGPPKLDIDRILEDPDEGAVVVIGEGEASTTDGSVVRFAFNDVFTFDGDKIARVESYVVPLTDPE